MTMDIPSLFAPGRGAVPDMTTAVRDAIAAGQAEMRFRFAFGEVPINGTLAPDGPGYRLHVHVPVGIVPFTAEDREARQTLRAAIDEIRHSHPDNVGVDPHQVIFVKGSAMLAPPMTAVSIVTALVALMMDVRPLLDAIADVLPDLRSALPVSRG